VPTRNERTAKKFLISFIWPTVMDKAGVNNQQFAFLAAYCVLRQVCPWRCLCIGRLMIQKHRFKMN
jgi:hypothetical protein